MEPWWRKQRQSELELKTRLSVLRKYPTSIHRSSSTRQHPCKNGGHCARLMLAHRALKRVGTLEGVGPRNLHLPAIVSLRSDDDHPPVSGTLRKHVIHHGGDIPLHLRIARVVHFDRYRHTQSLRHSPMCFPFHRPLHSVVQLALASSPNGHLQR